ncbi:MAG: chitobiase/beta-hexosaminidase C-terminal domain-containing protein [Candidatus Cloacimonetes bacterium]|nr:chitobiase/beta-hexosaminidase C-terminal domain-containing protein [Candidatus Cloacimonadota bacterium]MDD4686837.1 chitobiase/beta-hexosaminidase C-terminal domain-containing protein [Candidatus Cloacimonadota bacterium]
MKQELNTHNSIFTNLHILLLSLCAFLMMSCSDTSPSWDNEPLEAPQFSPSGGVFNNDIEVLIYSKSYGATIHYTMDGSEPNTESSVYSGLIQVNTDTTIKARAYKDGCMPSTISTADFVFDRETVMPVEISPIEEYFYNPVLVTMSCPTSEAEIYYTTDGTSPDQNSLRYEGPFEVETRCVVKAKAYAENMISSLVTTAFYDLAAHDPVFSVEPGIYSDAQIVSLSCETIEADIRYTTDGSEPDETSMLYTDPIEIAVNTIIKARSFYSNWIPSSIVSGFYIINLANQMEFIPAGSFNNGTANVNLSAFYIGKREITELEWVYVMLDMDEIRPDMPITEINWNSAVEYCNRRSIIEGYEPCYEYSGYGVNPNNWPNILDHQQITCNWNANGYRMPTEMEWMYAARGGHLSNDYIYSGSDNIDLVAWYSGSAITEPQFVGTKEPNELGLYDMSGNVWEFCWDFYIHEYTNTQSTDPVGPSSGQYRVLRGGSFSTDATNCTVSRRFSTPANLTADAHGLRVARKY